MTTETSLYRKEVVYDRESRDYALYLNSELVGFARSYSDGEKTLDELVFELLSSQSGITQDDAKRFWRKVKKDGDCWLWNASTNGRYGQIHLNRRLIHAHVFSFLLHYGPIPEGQIVRHECDNPICVNPAHLKLGTYADNTADMMERRRNTYVAHPGETNGRAKLTSDQVRHIRSTYTGKFGEAAALARQYGLTKTSMSRLLRGITWCSS